MAAHSMEWVHQRTHLLAEPRTIINGSPPSGSTPGLARTWLPQPGDRVPSSGVPPDRLEQDRTRQCQTLLIAEIDVDVDSCATILSLGPDGGIVGAAERQKCPELGELACHLVRRSRS
jgi:hypothetical protein